MMKRYRGWRDFNGTAHVTVKVARRSGHTLPMRLDLSNHSPDGFEWGYAGSGPAQTALAILAHCLGDDARALRLHQDFKFKVIAHLPEERWALTEEEVRKAVTIIEEERK